MGIIENLALKYILNRFAKGKLSPATTSRFGNAAKKFMGQQTDEAHSPYAPEPGDGVRRFARASAPIIMDFVGNAIKAAGNTAAVAAPMIGAIPTMVNNKVTDQQKAMFGGTSDDAAAAILGGAGAVAGVGAKAIGDTVGGLSNDIASALKLAAMNREMRELLVSNPAKTPGEWSMLEQMVRTQGQQMRGQHREIPQ